MSSSGLRTDGGCPPKSPQSHFLREAQPPSKKRAHAGNPRKMAEQRLQRADAAIVKAQAAYDTAHNGSKTLCGQLLLAKRKALEQLMEEKLIQQRTATGLMPVVRELVDSLDVQPDRKQLVGDILHELGYSLDEQVGESLGALTEPQLQNVRVEGAGLNVREINALLVKFKPQGYKEVQPCQEMQSFWQALSAAESQQVGDARFLTMTSSGFPGEDDTTKKALLVRTCYEDLADIVQKHFAASGKIFILSGNPSIGKSLFSFYFMWLLAKQEHPVVWERRHAAYARVMFSPQGVFSGNAESFNEELQKSSTWYMVDGRTPTRQNAKTILVSSPDHKIIHEPFKWAKCAMRWMPVWSWDEILLAGVHIFGQQEQDIRERYEKWLGIPRFVLQQTSQEHQESLDQAIKNCSIAVLKSSFTDLNADKQISHKLIHVTVKEGYFLDSAVLVKGYVENSLIAKYVESTDREVEYFLAASGGISDIASFRGKVLEKRKAHQILQRGGSFLCRDLQSHGDPFQLELPQCPIRAPLWSHQEMQTLPDGVYGWGRNENYAAVDAVCQPDLLYQVTVSEQHGINTRGLASAATKLRSGPGDAKLIFAVPPDVFTHDFSKQTASRH